MTLKKEHDVKVVRVVTQAGKDASLLDVSLLLDEGYELKAVTTDFSPNNATNVHWYHLVKTTERFVDGQE